MTSLLILDSLQQSLLADAASPLVLLGTASDDGVTLLGCARCEAIAADLQDVADVLPMPLALQGAYAPSRDDSVRFASAVQKLGFCAGPCVAAFLEDGTLGAVSVRADGTLGPSPAIAQLSSLDDWLKGCRMLRCELPICLELVEDEATDFCTALAIATANIVRQLGAPGQLYLAEAGSSEGSSSSSGRLLLRPDSDDLLEQLPGTCGRAGGSSTGVVQCRLLQYTASLAAPPAGLAFTYQPLAPARAAGVSAAAAAGGGGGASKAVCRSAALRLDVLCFAPRRCTVRWAVAALTQGLVRQANAAQRLLARQGKAVQVCAYHHLPPGLGHHLTLLYPALLADAELNDLKLLPLRQRLHALLRLPPNRPLLRPANALDVSAASEGAGDEAGGAVSRLRDVHAGLAAPGEDLKKVQQGTWVGWKRPGDSAAAGGPLFVADAFYNFLLPQRPNTV
ncbi:putative Ufm1-specific protease [Tetrabaena socialis]|uniref:Putative Ufm1-specific protease n=1 Tax=Tetrabaena socialis TaxID=47790 RepID=A0A2J7ZVL9_9CHLO|nr:putative Ufm1-specific protease [Tetrabaena socialis]|eukprot:PNH04300.1 putative Ufm1-specific protease [Tetrabaena socialis]